MSNKNHLQLLIVLLLSMLLASIACSKRELESQTADTKAFTSEHTEHVATSTDGDSESDAWNKVCPVCGGPVTADLETVTHEGQVYGFGCAGCPEKFRENPQEYVKNLSENGTEYIGG